MKTKTKFVLASLLCTAFFATAIGISHTGHDSSVHAEDPAIGWDHKFHNITICETWCGNSCNATSEQCTNTCAGAGSGGGHCPV